MLLFTGLGNPGKEYEKTRHNIGFMAVDVIADHYSFSSSKVKFHGQLCEGIIEGEKILILKPQTYMNRSGLSVGETVKFYKIPLDNIIVFHDDIDLQMGKVRVKTGGGAGGHNGLKDIDNCIGKNYKRVRIGVGHPGDKDDVSNYVLDNFPKAEESYVEKLIESIAENCRYLTKGDDNLFMTRLKSPLSKGEG